MRDTEFLIAIGATVKRIRIAHHLKQCELANLCQFQRGTMSKIESGKCNITIATLKQIGDCMDVPVRDFF